MENMSANADAALQMCMQKPGLPQLLDNHPWGLNLMFDLRGPAHDDLDRELHGRRLLITCSSLGSVGLFAASTEICSAADDCYSSKEQSAGNALRLSKMSLYF